MLSESPHGFRLPPHVRGGGGDGGQVVPTSSWRSVRNSKPIRSSERTGTEASLQF